MEYRYLGKSGLKISEIGLGVMTFGGDLVKNEIATVSQKEAENITLSALDLGINLFDTADIYSGGVSETALGKALGNRRKDAVVATKVRFAMSNSANDTGLSRYHIIKSCENSLRRLGTDFIDLYQIHSYDPGTPLEETLRALDYLIQTGKVRYIGCSNLTAWQTMKALALSEKLNLEKFITTQLYYSIGARDIEHELVSLCIDQNIGILVWSPLSGGFFTGKYRKNAVPIPGARRNKPISSNKYWPIDEEKGFEIVEHLDQISKLYDKTIAQTAINWILNKPAISSVIVGAGNIQQLKENASATGWHLSRQDVDYLDSISRPTLPYPVWHQNYSDER